MIKKTIKFFVKKNDHGKRLDVFLSSENNEFTRSYLKKMIISELVKINSKIIKSPSYKLKKGELIKLTFQESKTNKLSPWDIKLEIIFEDEDILIINKPKGLVVHPGAGNKNNTLANALVNKYKNKLSNLNGEMRPGIVHRIDKNTSGLLVVAKNNFSHAKLSKQFEDHSILRKYLCLVWGVVRPLSGRVETLISRSKKNRQLMMTSDTRGKRAITNYKTIKTFDIKNIPKISLLECELETGRTHQIRVHMKFKGTSLLGDQQYGKKNIKFKKIDKNFEKKFQILKGQALHAKSLGFFHPKKKKWMNFEKNLPQDFKDLLQFLENHSS